MKVSHVSRCLLGLEYRLGAIFLYLIQSLGGLVEDLELRWLVVMQIETSWLEVSLASSQGAVVLLLPMTLRTIKVHHSVHFC
ncbi:hypothetical protein D3C77_356090 [compost metagenome]